MKDQSESDFGALADMQVKYEEAAKATENIPIVKYGRALASARARLAATPPAQKSVSIESAAMPTIKEPEHITLVEGLAILQNNGLSTKEAKTRLRQAFVAKAFLQAPLFGFEYDDADIDWTTGSVKIPRKKERFCPTFLRSDFERYFFKERDAPRSYSHMAGIAALQPNAGIGALRKFDSIADYLPVDASQATGQQLSRDMGPPHTVTNEEESKEASSDTTRSELLTLKPTFMGFSKSWRGGLGVGGIIGNEPTRSHRGPGARTR